MITSATAQKRQELKIFIEHELIQQPAIQAVVGIGSIASGLARPDSDIDAIIFLDPFDWYIVPAEFKWCLSDGSFHSIFTNDLELGKFLQFDFTRFDLAQWADPAYDWPEGQRAELHQGWMAFDREGQVTELIANRTAYNGDIRRAKLDGAITWLDGHLSADGMERRWNSLGPVIAHDRLFAAYYYLVQALFAYNSCWRPWRNREMSALLAMPWLPTRFADQILVFMNGSENDFNGYVTRVEVLRSLFHSILDRLVSNGEYSTDVISEAFIRGHQEPGRSWNMDEWNMKHREWYG